MQLPQVTELKGIRVLTTKQIAEAYEADVKTIQYNFRYNKKRYILGKHYIEVTGEELRRLKTRNEFQSCFKYAKSIYLWTEKGALLHAKSLNTDKAWEAYDYLVDFYFEIKEEKLSIVPKTEVVPVKASTSPFKSFCPEKGMLVNIPENKEAQELLSDMRKYLKGMEALLDIYNMYLEEEEFKKVAGTLEKMEGRISRTAHFLTYLKPKIIEKCL